MTFYKNVLTMCIYYVLTELAQEKHHIAYGNVKDLDLPNHLSVLIVFPICLRYVSAFLNSVQAVVPFLRFC